MTVLELSLAMDCPMRCSYCPQDKANATYQGPRLMDINTFTTALANWPDVEHISIAGFAEPYLNPDCWEMILRAVKTGKPVSVFTTAVGMNHADITLLKSSPPKEITLHFPDANGHMKFNPTAEYVEVVKSVLASGLDVRVMSMGNVHPALVPLVGNLGPNKMHTRAGNVQGTIRLAKQGALTCGPAPALDHPVMLPDGRLTLCCMDYGLTHVIGNLAERTWAEIYADQPLRDIRALMQQGSCLCRTCEYAKG